MKRTLRWIFFIPIGLLAYLLVGVIINLFTALFMKDWIAHTSAAVSSACAFFISCMNFAPVKNNVVKWISLIILYAIGLCLVGAWWIGVKNGYLLPAIMTLIIATIFATLPADEIE